jgi:hypothetical protein
MVANNRAGRGQAWVEALVFHAEVILPVASTKDEAVQLSKFAAQRRSHALAVLKQSAAAA